MQPSYKESAPAKEKILLFSQVFYPDVVAVAQHLTDLAESLAEAGHFVTVLTADRAYDNPKLRFQKSHAPKGVLVRRVPVLGLGKKSKFRRIVTFASFLISSTIALTALSKQDVVVVLSTPPLLSVLAALFVRLRGGKLVYWVMDLNPDEAIAAGWMHPQSPPARILEKLSRFSLHASDEIVVLDRFMQHRLLQKGVSPEKIHIIPPWPHEDSVAFDASGRASRRSAMGWQDKFVVLYSGNHSPLHPIDTLLQAALRLRDRDDIVFLFSGGGSELPRVQRFAEDNHLTNIHTQTYCPIQELAKLLSSADLHVVLLGDPFVGIVHPCKIYNMLSLRRPILYIGPEESHIMDMRSSVDFRSICHTARHGECVRVAEIITTLAANFHNGMHTSPSNWQSDMPVFSQKQLMAEMLGLTLGLARSQTADDLTAQSRPVV